MNVVIFSTFKPFLPDFETEQLNALRSWKKLRCNPKIVIIGDDFGVKDICKQENVIHHPIVEKNQYGTPLVGDIFIQGWKYANDDDICIFVNGDIILTDSLCIGLDKFVKDYPNYKTQKFLITAIRWDWYNFKKIDFSDKKWEQQIKTNMKGKYANPNAIDLFIHRKNTIRNIPTSGIAKFAYDSWIVGYANSKFNVTINATKIIKIYHQFGKWYQDNKPCERGTKTVELIENAKSLSNLIRSSNYSKTKVTDCKITW